MESTGTARSVWGQNEDNKTGRVQMTMCIIKITPMVHLLHTKKNKNRPIFEKAKNSAFLIFFSSLRALPAADSSSISGWKLKEETTDYKSNFPSLVPVHSCALSHPQIVQPSNRIGAINSNWLHELILYIQLKHCRSFINLVQGFQLNPHCQNCIVNALLNLHRYNTLLP